MLLGIDIGTSSAKSVILDEDNGAVVAVGQQAYDFDAPQPGWAEQAPEMWWNAAKETIRAGCYSRPQFFRPDARAGFFGS